MSNSLKIFVVVLTLALVVMCITALHFYQRLSIQSQQMHGATQGISKSPENSDSASVNVGSLDPNIIRAAIDSAFAKLNVQQPDTSAFLSKKTLDVQQAIRTGDYQTADRMVREVVKQSEINLSGFYPFDNFFDSFSKVRDASYLNHLYAWADEDKTSYVPYLLRGALRTAIAWSKISDGYVFNLTSKNLKAHYLEKKSAAEDLDEAFKRDNSVPVTLYYRLLVASSRGVNEEAWTIFNKIVSQYPSYYDAYVEILYKLSPSWGGSVDEMRDFVKRYAPPSNETSSLKLLYVELYTKFYEFAKSTCYGSTVNRSQDCIKTVMSKLVDKQLEAKVVEALKSYSVKDKHHFEKRLEYILSSMAEGNDQSEYASALLQLASDALGVQIQLVENNPGRNNYNLDLVAAKIWQNKGSVLSALKKYNEALADLDNTTFQLDEEKHIARAWIYYQLSKFQKDNKDYISTIIYSKAAFTASGGLNKNWQFIQCETYYRLKLYDESVKSCSDYIDPHHGIEARYWRGYSYLFLNKFSEAIADFELVAKSNSRHRNAAVIAMSEVFGTQKLHDKMRDILTQYPDVFDPRLALKYTVWNAYNNRCYARMQLGELEEALADCTESLKYGNSPDTYQKQQTLIKMLKEKEK